MEFFFKEKIIDEEQCLNSAIELLYISVILRQILMKLLTDDLHW